MVSGKRTRYLRFAATVKPSAPKVDRPLRRRHAEGEAPPPDLGRHIYAYYHIRTNQVIYSLRHTLQVWIPTLSSACTYTDSNTV